MLGSTALFTWIIVLLVLLCQSVNVSDSQAQVTEKGISVIGASTHRTGCLHMREAKQRIQAALRQIC